MPDLKSKTLFFFVAIVAALSIPRLSMGQKRKSNIDLRLLNPNIKIQNRNPSNYHTDNSIDPSPYEKKSWLQSVFVEDDAGVMKSIKLEIKSWKTAEEYSDTWNLDSTDLYTTPDFKRRKQILAKKLLKYTDKRLSGELKKADKGTTLHKVKKVQAALKPNTTATISKNVRLRFKARVLRGKIFMKVENPYVDYRTDFSLSGKVSMKAGRTIQSIGAKAEANYDVNNKRWVALMDKAITKELKARLSSQQSDRSMAFGKNSDRTLQLLYNKTWH